jgi:hypothetical protein
METALSIIAITILSELMFSQQLKKGESNKEDSKEEVVYTIEVKRKKSN